MEGERERLRALLLKYRSLPGGPTQRRLAEFINCTEADISRGIDPGNDKVLSDEKVASILDKLAPLQALFDQIGQDDWARLLNPDPKHAGWMSATGNALRKKLKDDVESLLTNREQQPPSDATPVDDRPSAVHSNRIGRVLAGLALVCVLAYVYFSGWYCSGDTVVYRAYYWGIDTPVWRSAIFRLTPCGPNRFRVEADSLLKNAPEYRCKGWAKTRGKILELRLDQKNLFGAGQDHTLSIQAHILQHAGQTNWLYLEGTMQALSAHEQGNISTVRPIVLVPQKHLKPDCEVRAIEHLEALRRDSLWWQFKRPDEKSWLCGD